MHYITSDASTGPDPVNLDQCKTFEIHETPADSIRFHAVDGEYLIWTYSSTVERDTEFANLVRRVSTHAHH